MAHRLFACRSLSQHLANDEGQTKKYLNAENTQNLPYSDQFIGNPRHKPAWHRPKLRGVHQIGECSFAEANLGEIRLGSIKCQVVLKGRITEKRHFNN